MDAFIIYPNALTCLGSGEELWCRLIKGNCGLTAVSEVYPEWFPDYNSKIGVINSLTPNKSRLLQILVQMGDTIIPPEAINCELIIGASSLGDLDGEFCGDPFGCMRFYLQNYKPKLAPRFKGVVSSACSSGTDALSLAATLVHQGKYNIIGIMAADCLDPGKLLQHFALGTQSMDCAKPFDANRAGTSFGEGGAFAMVVNSKGLNSLSLKNGFNILGYGMSCDAMHITAPDESGETPSLAISRALQTANCSASDIGYINAHASGTHANDRVESIAFKKALGFAIDNIIVTGTKGAIGHMLGATGLVEAVLTCWSLSQSIAPGTIGLHEKDAEIDIKVNVGGISAPISKPVGLSTTFGFGGVNSAILIKN